MASGLEGTTSTEERRSTRKPAGWIWGGAMVTGAVWGSWWRGEILINVFCLFDATGHAEIADTAYAHLVDEDVLEFEICMNESHLVVKITYTADYLAEHHADIIMGQCGTTITLENVVESASRAEEHEEKVGIRGMDRVE